MDNNRGKAASKGKMLRGKPTWARGREPREGIPRGYLPGIILRGGVPKGDTKGKFQQIGWDLTSKGEMLRSKQRWTRGREPREEMPRGFFQK